MEIVPVPAALQRRVDSIRALDPPSQAVEFLVKSWASKAPCPEVEFLVDVYPAGRLARRDLFMLGQQALREDGRDERRRLLVATLMWGYGTRGGRSYTNANRVLAVRDLDRKLLDCAEAIHGGQLGNAVAALEGLSGYRSGYFTKFLYFLAREAHWGQHAKPLIFDSRVEGMLPFMDRALGVHWDASPLAHDSVASRYIHYCETAKSWAWELGLGPGVVGAEKIEQFLFGADNLRFDVYNEMHKLASAVQRDYEEGSAGPNTWEAAKNMNADLAGSVGPPAR